jgi:hypothetical protein
MKHGERGSNFALHTSLLGSAVHTTTGMFLKGADQFKKILALLLAFVVGGGVLVVLTASQAGASSEFTLGSHLTNLEFVTAKRGCRPPTPHRRWSPATDWRSETTSRRTGARSATWKLHAR